MIFFGAFAEDLIAKLFTLRTISVTSSLTPFIEENSCNTPSICTAVTAAPCTEDSKILLKAFPKVCPKPFSKGSATTEAEDLSSLLVIFNLFGFIRAFQLLSIILFDVCIILSFFWVALYHCVA